MSAYISIENTTIDMFHIGQHINIINNNNEELHASIQIIRKLYPLHRREIILKLTKPYRLYKDDKYEFEYTDSPRTVHATHPSISINRTILCFNIDDNNYKDPSLMPPGIHHRFIHSVQFLPTRRRVVSGI